MNQHNSLINVPFPKNEFVRQYEPGSIDKKNLKYSLESLAKEKIEIPCIINGKEVFTGNKKPVVMPHEHGHELAQVHLAGQKELEQAVLVSVTAQKQWEEMPWTERASIFLKAADLIAGPYRATLNAATMLGQSKNAYQAEIDSACEFIDFLRFNCYYYQEILKNQPTSPAGFWNSMEYRALEGFVLAITPFNFTAIAGNLPTAPAICGNTSVWKPSHTQTFSAYIIMKILKEAGLPDGVINFMPAEGSLTGKVVLPQKDLAGIHFTGSTRTFQTIYKSISENIENYKSYPRIVGETGGKDFIFAESTADLDALKTAMIRGAFEYQGQKCSAASRAYIPESIWKKIKAPLCEEISALKVGDVRDFSNFVNAVIDKKSFENIKSYIDYTKNAHDAQIIVGGECKDQVGYFVSPTLIETTNPHFKTMEEEIFGPVLTVYVYKDRDFDETLKICDSTSPYALTGAIFSQDRNQLIKMARLLRHSAGNFYINDKPTGAVVGQQPFGGARASGTNDKAGSYLNLLRFISPRTIKETFVPPQSIEYPFMLEK